MTSRLSLLALGAVALVGCGGGTGLRPTAPLSSAENAVKEFVAAATDSNITRMAQAWGNSRGPAAVTGEPPQWEQRLKVVQIYLRGGTWRLLQNEPDRMSTDRRYVVMEFTRGACKKSVPFTAVKSSGGGWLVESVDVTTAGNPMNPCPATPSTANP